MPVDPWKKYSCEGKTEDQLFSEFYLATKEGREDVLKIMVEKGKIDVNHVTEREKECQGLSALHLATRSNKLNCIKYLLSAGANVNAIDAFGFRPIHDAAMYGYLDCLNELLAQGAKTDGVERAGSDHITPLYYAAQQNHAPCVLALKDKYPDTDTVLLEMSSRRGNASLLELTKKENAAECDSLVDTWLQNSALSGHVKYLDYLKNFISRKLGSKENLHSIITATQHDKVEYLTRLLDSGIDPNTCTKDKATALHYAARYGHVECIELLVKYGADINMKTIENWTPLHIAVRQGCADSIDKLIQCGCNIDETGGDTEDTALHTALKMAVDEEVVVALLKGKPSLTVENSEGFIPTGIKSEFERLNELVLEYARN